MSAIHITMFGEFTIKCGDKIFTERDSRGSKMIALIQYLIAHRDRRIPQSELIDFLWQDSDNPANALKTLVHRTREILKNYLPEGAEFILSEHGTYGFNKELDYHIDSGEFAQLVELGDNEVLSRAKRIDIYRRALALYKGGYLSSYSEENWVRPINVYFHTLYTSIVEKCVKILYPMGRFADIVIICEQAMIFNPYNENTHAHLIRAMVALGEYALAEKQYNYVKQLLLEQFGTQPSPRLTELYELTVKPRSDTQRQIDVVLGDLWEDDKEAQGGYFCEYEVFRYIFRLYVRESRRLQNKLSVLLITLQDENGEEPTDKNRISKAMAKMSDSISSSLRMRDVFARYSRCQYIVMLPDADYDDGKVVEKRISGKYNKYGVKNGILAKFARKELTEKEKPD